LLMYEEAQPFEIGLMNTRALCIRVGVRVSESGLGARVGLRVRVMNRLSCGVSLLATRPLLLHQRLLLR
jgi:hypothetical protein